MRVGDVRSAHGEAAAVRSYRSAIYLWAMLAVLFVAGLLTLHPIYAELCQETGQPGQKDCATYHVALIAAWQIGEFLRNYHSLLTALATLAIAAFTWTTPAHDLRSNGGIAFSTFPLREPLIEEEQFFGAGTLGPGLEYNLNIGARGITQEQWNALVARTHALYVHGSYTYRDVFDQPRAGTFCFYYGGAQGLRVDRILTFYPEGNSSD
jgi:hypothetical protein